MRVLLALVIFVALVGVANGATNNRLTLRAVEKAFFEAKIPFSQEWRPTPPNPYLMPSKSNGPASALRPRWASHLIGTAAYVNATTFKSRTVYVFDGATVASDYLAWMKAHCRCGGSVVEAVRNVVFFGSPAPAVTAAMNRLRK